MMIIIKYPRELFIFFSDGQKSREIQLNCITIENDEANAVGIKAIKTRAESVLQMSHKLLLFHGTI